jgi:hypothetical protein
MLSRGTNRHFREIGEALQLGNDLTELRVCANSISEESMNLCKAKVTDWGLFGDAVILCRDSRLKE